MSGRFQPTNGADSQPYLPTPDELDPYGYFGPTCRACSLPAVTDGYCAGHARLMEYTDHERSGGIAANE